MNETGMAYNEELGRLDRNIMAIQFRVDVGTRIADQNGGVTRAHVGDLKRVNSLLREAIDFLDAQDGLED